MREWTAAVQNELRNLGFKLLTAQQTSFVAALMGIRVDDCVSAVDIQSFIDRIRVDDCVSAVDIQSFIYRWFSPCRWGEAEGFGSPEGFAWPERGHGFIDAIRLAELAEGFAWPERGHGLIDAIRLAQLNLLQSSEKMPKWFHPNLAFQVITHLLSTADPGTFVESTHLLTTADPGTFVVRYSTTPGCFAVQTAKEVRD
ncbi:hypothetical protein T484DRAFT_1857366 [Baffinella frigidus]|nr:hypothetical protein T484DRAFT_1857366 [Cryptophyta sp. CCMP2293]